MTDAQIAAVKERRAADWVRVQAAGMETELGLMRQLERDAFFFDQPRTLHLATYWLLLTSVEFYRHACTDTTWSFGPNAVGGESANMLQRDFTGPDCTGFAYDLFRPGEPYAARGLHPNGDGIRRVRLTGDLTGEEREFLVRMRNLGVLNFIDPALFGFPRFSVTLPSGRELAFAASLQHDLTAFGDAFGLSLRAQYEAWNFTGAVRLYRNQLVTLPGLAIGVFRFPVHEKVRASLTAELWLQPGDFAFATASVMPGGAVEAQLAVRATDVVEVFIAGRAKSAGWRAVDPYLDASVSGRVGFNLFVPQR